MLPPEAIEQPLSAMLDLKLPEASSDEAPSANQEAALSTSGSIKFPGKRLLIWAIWASKVFN